jgi:nucleoid DNA-binding protein
MGLFLQRWRSPSTEVVSDIRSTSVVTSRDDVTKNLRDMATELGLKNLRCDHGCKIDGIKLLEEFFNHIIDTLKDGEAVRIKNFGTFSAKVYKGRTIVSPVIPKGKQKFGDNLVLRFHQATGAKQRLNADDDEGGK